MSEGVVSMQADGREAFETRDVFLLSTLMAIGIAPSGADRLRIITPEHEAGRRFLYCLSPRSDCGKYETGEMVKAWKEGIGWIKKNPDHPFSFAMAAQLNFKNNERFAREAGEYVYLTAGSSVALVPMDASLELEEEILGSFK